MTLRSQIGMIPLSVAALTNAHKSSFSALISSDVKAPTGNSADYKQAAAGDLGRMGIIARTQGIFYGPPTGRGSERTTMAVVAEINDDADRFLRMVVGGRPLSSSVMLAAANFGAIPLRDGSTQANAKLLPFDGDEYGVFAFIEPVALVNEVQGNARLSYTQRLMVDPVVQSAATDLIAAEDGAVARYTTDSAPEMLEPEQRRTASVKLAYHRNLREGMLKISESPDKFILVATQPLQSFPFLDALDATTQLIPRDDSGRAVARRRSALARQAAIATVIVRKGCESSVDARAAMMAAKQLLRTPTPPAARENATKLPSPRMDPAERPADPRRRD